MFTYSRSLPFARALAVAGGLTLALLPGVSWSQAKDGGELTFAQSSNPPSLDAMATSSAASRNINMNVYEMLYAFDENVQPMPVLADGLTISDDGLSYVFALRQGVKFHNGKEMTAKDVVASLERYRKVGATAQTMVPVDKIEATGDYEVTLTLNQKTPTFLEAFCSPRAPTVIIPEEDANAEAGKTSLIGTGPYKIVDYVPDSHVTLEKFADYTQDTRYDGPDGFGGKKTAHFDKVTFRIMPEPGAQVAALESGEVDILELIPGSAAKRLGENSDITLYENNQWAFLTLILNTNEAPTDNIKFREAVQVALNMEEVLGIATEGMFALNGRWVYEGTPYDFGDAGAGLYDGPHPDRVKALLSEAGYNGEPFSILTDNNIPVHGRSAVVIAEQLQAAGINAVINQVDWPTALNLRMQDTGWQGWTLSMGIEPYLGPAAIVSTLTGTRPHFVKNDPALDALYEEFITGETLEARKATFQKISDQLYAHLGVIKIGDTGIVGASRANIKGYSAYRYPRVYDIWRE